VPHLVPAEFKGTLILPDDPRYDAARRVWNGRIDRRPALIARCLDAQDVRAGLLFAREHCLPLAVRGGGHSCAGFGTCDDGVVLDLSSMKSRFRFRLKLKLASPISIWKCLPTWCLASTVPTARPMAAAPRSGFFSRSTRAWISGSRAAVPAELAAFTARLPS
jgi:hypothetical protein